MSEDIFTPGPRADYFCKRPTCDGGSSPEDPYRDLPIKKPKCPSCGATRWMIRLYAGYSPRVSTSEGRTRIAVNESIGPEMDRQHNQHMAAQHAQIHDPWAPKLVGASGLASAIPGVPIALPNIAGASKAIPGMPRGLTVVADGMRGPSRMAPTVIAGTHKG